MMEVIIVIGGISVIIVLLYLVSIVVKLFLEKYDESEKESWQELLERKIKENNHER